MAEIDIECYSSPVEYVLLDSSQLIQLCQTNSIGVLSSPGFVEHYGFPFLTMHNLIELAGTADYPVFESRLDMLSSVKNFHTLNYGGNPMPGSVSDLATFEVEAATKIGTHDFGQIRSYIRSRIKAITVRLSEAEMRYIYQESRVHRARTSLLSTLNNPLLSPFYNVRMRELEDIEIDYSDRSKLLNFLGKFTDTVKSRGLTEKKTSEVVKAFLQHLGLAREDVPNGSRIVDIIEKLSGEVVNPQKTLEYYMQRYLFRMQLRNVAKVMGIQPSAIDHFQMDELRVLNLSILIKHELEISIAQDARRAIETSSVDDLYLVLHGLVIDVFADKRTIELVRRVNRALHYDLQVHQVTYKFSV